MATPPKTDLNFRLAMLKKENMNNINFIIKTSKSVIAALGSNGKPTMNDLCAALKDSQKINIQIDMIQSLPDNPSKPLMYTNLKDQVAEIKQNTVDALLSKSYAFYTPEAIDGLSDENKRINELKNRNLDNLTKAYSLGKAQGIRKIIDSCIKTNRALAILPFSKNGPDHPAILDNLEELIDRNTKTLQQLEFQNNMRNPEPKPKTKLASDVQTLEAAEEQPGE